MVASDLANSPRAWRIWAVCAELTASYSKSADRVYVSTIANLANVRPDHASPVLRQFDAEGIYIWRKDVGRKSPGFLALPSYAEPKPSAPVGDCPKCGTALKIGKASDLDATLSDAPAVVCPKPHCGYWMNLDVYRADQASQGSST